ncbi:hypothetical protein HMN09_01188100 [Mycena chlorophos]|uniref:Uncharacterized protein n=1 Tax=Mycena chlorophos TaxID=658473 RepID=A0A8H6S7V1_MYCCL|nr:hypothetical protein HMN09_01188100 [Mycena chlorophos]
MAKLCKSSPLCGTHPLPHTPTPVSATSSPLPYPAKPSQPHLTRHRAHTEVATFAACLRRACGMPVVVVVVVVNVSGLDGDEPGPNRHNPAWASSLRSGVVDALFCPLCLAGDERRGVLCPIIPFWKTHQPRIDVYPSNDASNDARNATGRQRGVRFTPSSSASSFVGLPAQNPFSQATTIHRARALPTRLSLRRVSAAAVDIGYPHLRRVFAVSTAADSDAGAATPSWRNGSRADGTGRGYPDEDD